MPNPLRALPALAAAIALSFCLWTAVPCGAQESIRISIPEILPPLAVQPWVNIVREAYARSGIPLEFVKTPMKRALMEADKGRLDGLAARLPAIEANHPNLVRVPTPLRPQVEFTAFAIREDIAINGWDSLRSLRVATILGTAHVEQQAERTALVYAATIEQAFDLLAQNRVDVVVFVKHLVEQTLRHNKRRDIHALSPSLESHNVYHYLNARHEHTVLPKLDKALRAMNRDGTTDAIIKISNVAIP